MSRGIEDAYNSLNGALGSVNSATPGRPVTSIHKIDFSKYVQRAPTSKKLKLSRKSHDGTGRQLVVESVKSIEDAYPNLNGRSSPPNSARTRSSCKESIHKIDFSNALASAQLRIFRR